MGQIRIPRGHAHTEKTSKVLYITPKPVVLEKRKFEFPKKYDVQRLYKMLVEIAEANVDALNR